MNIVFDVPSVMSEELQAGAVVEHADSEGNRVS
jgi:hypothetical protein